MGKKVVSTSDLLLWALPVLIAALWFLVGFVIGSMT